MMGATTGLKRSDLILQENLGELVMPGDEFLSPANQTKIVIGPGLKQLPGKGEDKPARIIACKSGILKKVKPNTYLVEVKTKHYDNYKKDDVLGIIKQKGKGEHYACDVGMKERAQLSKFAFEGATKRFRPDLQVGDVVYGKVVDLPKDYPMEITCVHASGKALGLGSLEGGHIFQVPVYFTRVLRSPVEKENILKKIGKIVPCETTVGVNGLVWVKAKNSVLTLLVSQFIQKLAQSELKEYELLLKQFRKGISSLAV